MCKDELTASFNYYKTKVKHYIIHTLPTTEYANIIDNV
ncbi:MAG: hypothetical protein JWN76_3489 [Chitinophagaceae bacterium]|nr:hypothetical protein [Chitinophagaceae bacterium]